MKSDWTDMKTRIFDVLKQGGVAILPTETSYMLAGNGCNAKTVQRILRLKNRPDGMSMSCAFPSWEAATRYIQSNPAAERLQEKFLPGPLTLVLPLMEGIKVYATATEYLGIRIPGLDALLEILAMFDFPVTATSANPHGSVEPYRVDQCVQEVDLIWDAGELGHQPPSTIIRIEPGECQILREGIIPGDRIRETIKTDL